jgi:hypothetical protein
MESWAFSSGSPETLSMWEVYLIQGLWAKVGSGLVSPVSDTPTSANSSRIRHLLALSPLGPGTGVQHLWYWSDPATLESCQVLPVLKSPTAPATVRGKAMS